MKRLLAVIYLLITPLAAFAISDSAGTKNGAFLKIPTDARGVALGPSVVCSAEGSDALRWNPAGLGMQESKEFSATHIQYYQDIGIENEGFAYPLEESGIGASLFYLSPGSLDGRDDQGNSTGNFQFYDLVGTIGYGRRLMSAEQSSLPVYVGGSLKIAMERIAETQYQNPAVDLGVMVLPASNIRVGLTVRNLSTSKANFPKEFLGGASYTVMKVFTGAFALTYADDAPTRYNVSGEYKFPELENSVLRVGYQNRDPLDDSTDAKISAFRNASLAGLTMGAGLEYQPVMFKMLHFSFDYAMAPFGALGISHTITLKAKW